ncbi:MAG: hypothetical protein AAF441_08315 [Pseudomonadota bacterium]
MPKPSQLLLWAAIAVACFMGWQHYQRVYEDKGRLTTLIEGDTLIMSWQSKIDLPMARRMIEAFEESGDRVKRVIVDLSSQGGSIYEGREAIRVINRMKRTHRVDTHVGPGRICLSMCVPIFLQGQNRIAAADSRWMFHEPYHADQFSGAKVDKPKFEEDYSARKFFNRYFTNSPMNADWRRGLEAAWKGNEIWKTGKDLVDERSNIITRLYSGTRTDRT